MAKSRASFVKRQREIEKKQKREAKLQRRLERKNNPGAPEEMQPIEGDASQETSSPSPAEETSSPSPL